MRRSGLDLDVLELCGYQLHESPSRAFDSSASVVAECKKQLHRLLEIYGIHEIVKIVGDGNVEDSKVCAGQQTVDSWEV